MARNTTSTDPGAGKPDAQTSSHGAHNRGLLEHGRCYTGVISEVSGSSYDVEVSGSGLKIAQCRWALGIFLGLAGFRTGGRLSVGDKVVVLYGNPSYITTTIPSDLPDNSAPRSRTHTGYGVDKLLPDNTEGVAQTMANDIMEGEFEIANQLGMAMVFCTNLISMKAGDRAKVEVSMINDMVRFVSNEFRHHSALGDDTIFDDGRLNAESNYTYYRHESHGSHNEDDPLATLVDNQYRPEDSELDPENATGFWRASLYKGWLGDFLHWFISDPQKALAATIGKEEYRSGRSRVWSGSDGSILVQSVSDIVLERVVRIQVPRRKKLHSDSEGNTPEDFKTITAKYLKAWTDTDPEKPWERAFQLRQYGRWLSQYRSFARFRAASKDWEVPNIEDVPAPDKWQCDKEVEKADQDAKEWLDQTYATIRIYRDGSIGLEEAGGASMVMAHGSIWLSSARHLNIEAAGDIRLIAGRNIIMKARRSIDLVAVVGGLVLKSRTWWRALCEQGSVWIKSDADDPDPDRKYPPGEGYEEPKLDMDGDPPPAILPYAVVLQASRGQTLVKSERTLSIKTVGKSDTEEPGDVSASVLLESTLSGVSVKTKKAFNVYAGTIGMISSYFVAKIAKVSWSVASLFNVNGGLIVRDKTVNAYRIKAKNIAANQLSGGNVGPLKLKESTAPMKAHPHYNHVHFLEKGFEVQVLEPEERDEFVVNGPGRAPSSHNQPLSWQLMIPEEYHWDEDEKKCRYISPTQQTLAIQMDDGDTELKEWNWDGADQKLKTAPETGNSVPFGYSVLFRTHKSGNKADGSGALLRDVISTPDVKSSVTSWTTTGMKFIIRGS